MMVFHLGECYNGEWRYILQYLFFLQIIPIVFLGLHLADRLFQKHRPLFIFLSAAIGHRTEGHFPRALLSFFGRYSTFIWLIHTFFLYYYWQSLALLPRYSILIYIWTVIVSLVVSIDLDAVLQGIQHATASFKALIIRKKEKLS